MPQALEAVALTLMVFAFTNERLYGGSPSTYTRCVERVDGRCPVVVGGFGSDGLIVGNYDFDDGHYGLAALRKF